jgi:hypothetical protein
MLLALLTACFGADGTVTPSGKGYPQPSIRFPQTVSPGSLHRAVLTIANPGPSDLDSLLVVFSRLGRVPDEPVVPTSIVDAGFKGHNPSVVSVRPHPVSVSQDGLVYRFKGLKEGSTAVVRFTLRMPSKSGVAANAVIVSDGRDLDRSRGLPLETTVRG